MNDQLPVAVWQGEFTIFGVTLRCATLDNGQRVIQADDVERLFAVMANTDAPAGDDIMRFSSWQHGQA